MKELFTFMKYAGIIFFRLAFLVVFSTSLAFDSVAQQADEPYKVRLDDAYQTIQNLKKGVLLVRLHDKQNQINVLLDRGAVNYAKRVEKEQLIKNRRLVEYFRNYYNFCPVLFFYSSDSDQIKAKQFKGNLRNNLLERDSTITLSQDTFYLVAEHGLIRSDVMGTSFEGLVVRNDQFDQIPNPFPQSVRKHSGMIVLERSDLKLVKQLNERFINFHNVSRGIRNW